MGKPSTKGYDWIAIQKYYDKGHTYRETSSHFNVNMSVIAQAKKEGLIKTRNRSEARKLSHVTKGSKKHTQETKELISKIRIEYLRENPDKVPYKLNHYSKGRSYAEQYFYDWLIKEGVNFEEQVQVGPYQLDFVVGDIDLEIDGEQHYLDNRIVKSDIRRSKYLEDLGYKILRVRWSTYQKQCREDKSKFLSDLLNKIVK